MHVPLFDMAAELAAVRPDVDVAIARVLDQGVFIGGNEVSAFELELARATSRKFAIGTSSGTDALHLLAMALRIGPGDEVVTTPFTFFATAGSFARLGAKIVFADIDDTTLILDTRCALTACNRQTRAIVPVNLFGYPAARFPAPCPTIEDAAHGFGETAGLAAAMSFFPTKNLGALGDAGAIVTDDDELARRVSLLRSHGASPKYHHAAVGGNFRIDALQAAVLRVKLRYGSQSAAARRSCAARYRALFASYPVPPELRLPLPHANHSYHQFVIRAPKRDALRHQLTQDGIGTAVYYPEPLHLQPCFAALGYRSGSLPVAENACQDVLALPIHPTLTAAAQELVVERIAAFYRSH